jgi:hypothetical protein
MRKAMASAIVSVGILAGISGLASAHVDAPMLLVWWHDEAERMAQCPGSALGYWCEDRAGAAARADIAGPAFPAHR